MSAREHRAIVLRPIANPLPLGFLALAAGDAARQRAAARLARADAEAATSR